MIYGIQRFMGFKKTKSLQIIYQGTMAEATVAQKLHQERSDKKDVIPA